MTYDFKKSSKQDMEMELGEWNYIGGRDGRKSALLRCPKCGQLASLFQHDIDINGVVTPSVLHRWPYGENQEESCGFHEMIKLLDWTP